MNFMCIMLSERSQMGCIWYDSIYLTLWKGKGSDAKWTSGYGGAEGERRNDYKGT